MKKSKAAIPLVIALAAGLVLAAPPQYDIYDIGIVQADHFASQGFSVSPGGIATGRSFGAPTFAFTWTVDGGLVGLPNLASPVRNFSVGNDVNDQGTVVGTGSTTTFGSNPLPLIWKNGVVSQLPLPAGELYGRAFGVNGLDTAVGSVGSGSFEVGVIYSGGTASYILTQTPDGCFVRTAFRINDSGLVVGFGIDPSNAARNVGFLYDSVNDVASEVGALPGHNGAIAFDVSNAGYVVGTSMMNQGSGLPFIWKAGSGMTPIPLPVDTSQGSARGVNDHGWAVGTASSAYAIPFLYDGMNTYRIADLLPPGSGWDLETNTSSSAMGISNDGIIVGTGVHGEDIRAYAMVPRPSEVPIDIKAGGCPNPLNRNSHGVLPVALVGTGDFDLANVDLSSLRLSRADGVGGSVAPLEGPPGPHTTFEDVATPYLGADCACSDMGPDGLMDISLKFEVEELVGTLGLQSLRPGDWVELLLTGMLLDGGTFTGRDCVLLVPPGAPPGLVSVSSSAPGTWIDIEPDDLDLDGGGFAGFDRVYAQSTLATLTAPEYSDGRTFQRWLVNGLELALTSRTLDLTVIGEKAEVRAEYGPKNPTITPGKPRPRTTAPAPATSSIDLQ